MTRELSSRYVPSEVESQIARRWDQAGAFHAEAAGPGDPYAIFIPPPNVTAALHMGHALNNTLQDVLIRWQRMMGRNAMWMPGTDHAGIATQTVVDRRLKEEGEPALADYKKLEADGKGGREQFIAKVQAWKDEYEARIVGQLKAMGCSCDWDRQRFTMDPICAAAVREAFFILFRDGLIYRGKRLVNWDPVTQTALADDEVEMRDVDGHFWYLRYPLADGSGHVTVATTRPETMLGDTAVAVNPRDPRAAALRGKMVKLPIVNRLIPIIEDDYVVLPNPESSDEKAKFSSGFLKVTPAHDPNDYEIGRRFDLPMINVMAPDASISLDHGWPPEDADAADAFLRGSLIGQSREQARKRIVKWFEEQGLLEEVRPYKHAVGHSYRSHAAIEPYLSDQWYVKVTDDRLAGAALRAMADDQYQGERSASKGELRFYPARYARTFQTWHENIRDWCISRQLWWGHRIPVWSREETSRNVQSIGPADPGKVAVQRIGDVTYACLRCDDADLIRHLEAAGFVQDPDVLDTWFSSGLWPLSTLGWPEDTAALQTWNPSSVLCTAREIITLWVSRMVMFNLYFKGRLPFRDVFIHAMIQDGHGQKMSKSLGNGVDPIDIIHSHGADAMRFTLTAMTTQTQDVRLPVDMVCPQTGQSFTPKYIGDGQGHKVAAPLQESPHAKGQKMVSSYGVASGKAKPTDDMPLARNTSEKFDLGRNFANKLWNATRFALTNLTQGTPRDGHNESPGFNPTDLSLPDRWILSRLTQTLAASDKALANYEFKPYADGLYDFVWRDFCDWYLEAIKPTVKESVTQQHVLASVLDASLRLLHPVMPYVTEELWAHLNAAWPMRGWPALLLPPSELLVKAAWPQAAEGLVNEQAQRDFEWVQSVVAAIREVRTTYKVPPRDMVECSARGPAAVVQRALPLRPLVETLAGMIGREIGPHAERPADAAVTVVGDFEIYVHHLIDPDAERQRLTKRIDELQKSVKTLEGRLSNPSYVDKAPAKLVEQTREQLASTQRELASMQQQLAALSSSR